MGTDGQEIRVQKGIQRILEERGLWPSAGMNLECQKPKCGLCQEIANCKVCIKGMKCDACKKKRKEKTQQHSGDCGPARKCDACQELKNNPCPCCVVRQRCSRCEAAWKSKCDDCESLPPKCSSASNGQFILAYSSLIANRLIHRLLCSPPPFHATRLLGPAM
jgi:hypothetical protein